jgi:hypothetical protein
MTPHPFDAYESKLRRLESLEAVVTVLCMECASTRAALATLYHAVTGPVGQAPEIGAALLDARRILLCPTEAIKHLPTAAQEVAGMKQTNTPPGPVGAPAERKGP